MATPESYRPEESDSSPAPLPVRPPDRFQFSLKNLLVFMFITALFATAIHYAVQLLPPPPGSSTATIPVVFSLGAGALLYLMIRVPFLIFGAARATGRWQAIQQHRRDLAAWASKRREQIEQSGRKRKPPPET
jgi:hypothetical protein